MARDYQYLLPFWADLEARLGNALPNTSIPYQIHWYPSKYTIPYQIHPYPNISPTLPNKVEIIKAYLTFEYELPLGMGSTMLMGSTMGMGSTM